MEKKLSKTAYGGAEGSKYIPYITDGNNKKSLHFATLAIGCLMAIIFAASNTYAGLLSGMTAAAGIPGAIIGAGLLNIGRKSHVLETNHVQGMASAGESIASGMIFVFPAVLILIMQGSNVEVTVYQAIFAGMIGALLGVGFASIIRNYLIVQEHGKLLYPESMAIAETMVTSDSKGFGLKVMAIGGAVGAILVALSAQFLNFWNNTVSFIGDKTYQFKFQAEANPILIGIGYIVGLSVAVPMFAGGILANFAILPLIMEFTQYLPDTATAWDDPTIILNQASVNEIGSHYIRYIGAGMMMVGGFIGVIKLIPVISSSLKETFGKKLANDKVQKDLTGALIAVAVIAMAVFALYIGLTYSLNIVLMFVAATAGILLIFLFSVVASRMVGEVGTSNLPVSGMTIASLMVVTIIFVAFGATTPEDNVAIILIGSVIVTAIAASGGYSQTQKATFIIGGSASDIQKSFTIAAIVGVITVSFVIMFLAPLIVVENSQFAAPQANLMAALTKGILTGELPWVMIFIGGSMAIVLFLLKFPIMIVAIGFYLPFATVSAILVGALIRLAVDKTSFSSSEESDARNEKGVIYSSGLIAGGSIMGLITIGIAVYMDNTLSEGFSGWQEMISGWVPAFMQNNIAAIIGLIIVAAVSYYYIIKGKTSLDEE